MEHLVYCNTRSMELEAILSGNKTMVYRGSSRKKVPYGKVKPGDALFFALDEGMSLIRAKARVRSVVEHSKKSSTSPPELLKTYRSRLHLTEAQEEQLLSADYLCLVEVEDVTPVKPLAFSRPSGRANWEVLPAIEEIL